MPFPILHAPDTRAIGLEIGLEDGLRYARPQSDIRGTNWLEYNHLDREAETRWGMVVDVIPFLNAYRVNLGPRGFIWCGAVSGDSGFQPFSVRTGSVIPIGSLVYTLLHPTIPWWGTIIGAEPSPILGSNPFFVAGQIWPGSHCGYNVDDCHKATLNQPLSGGVLNLSTGRPLDQLTNDWSQFSDTGIGVLIDSFMAFLRVSEATGLFLFYHNQLARLAGHNLQIRSLLAEYEALDNKGESFGKLGISPYFWERLGAFEYPVSPGAISREFSAEQAQITQTEYGAVEPLFDNQQPFERFTEWTGYTGQGYYRTLSLPPPSPISSVNRYSDLNLFPGVFREYLSLAGSWNVSSAKRIVLRKTSSIPVPKLIARPEAPEVDDPDTYRSAGRFGTLGPPHLIKDEIGNPDPMSPSSSLVRAAAILDTLAFTANWEGPHPYAYHDELFYFPEEGDGPLGASAPPPNFNLLSIQQYLEPPAPITIEVDHRYGNAKYYPSDSAIAQLEDGSISITGGDGCEIRMAAGHVFISCPGDVWLQSGRNTNIWSGRDAIIKSHHSIDLTATDQDVRIKAQNNCMILAGNNAHGGVLIESRSVCRDAYDFTQAGEDALTSGIILKAAEAQVVSLGRDVVLRSGYKSASPGDVIIDSGNNRVSIYTKFLNRFLGKAAFDFFLREGVAPSPLFGLIKFGAGSGSGSGCGPGIGVIECANEYWCAGTRIGTSLYTRGEAQFGTCIWVSGGVFVTDGHILTSQSNSLDGKTSQLPDEDYDSISDQLATFDQRVCQLRDVVGAAELTWMKSLEDPVLLAKPEFSLRTHAQYAVTDEFALFETHWQQQARLDGQSMPVWIENYVSVAGDPNHTETYPYPGRDAWAAYPTSILAWYLQDLSLYDVTTGHGIPRGANQPDYENPEYAPLQKVCLDGHYTIVKQD